MKAKPSGLSATVIGIVIIVTMLLVVASASSPTASVAMRLGGQGGGRPTPTPRDKKSSTRRPRPKAPVSKASNGSKVSPDRNAGGNSNANANTRTSSTGTVSNANEGNRDSSAKPSVSSPVKSNPNAAIIVLGCSWFGKIDAKQNSLSEISRKKKVFLYKSADQSDEQTTLILKQYSGLEITDLPHADFVLNFCSSDVSTGLASASERKVRSVTTLLVTTDHSSESLPRIIWKEEAENTYAGNFISTSGSGKLTKRFVVELKKAQGDPDWDIPALRDDAEIILPTDFRKRESESENAIFWRTRQDEFSPIFGQKADKSIKPLNTSGSLSDISTKRKVFVNNKGEDGDKIIARLKAYGRLEIVQTASEADLAVWFDSWEREERYKDTSGPLGIWAPTTVKDVTGGSLFVTIRDPSAHVPRILWRNSDTDGGVFKRGDASDKLAKRFISELKKLRGEK